MAAPKTARNASVKSVTKNARATKTVAPSTSKRAATSAAPKTKPSVAPVVPSWHVAPDKTKAWKKLTALAKRAKSANLRAMFAKDKSRASKLSMQALDMHLDYSKNLVDSATLDALFALATECSVARHAKEMFAGELINITENRAVLHTALRAPRKAVIKVDGENVVPQVHAVLDAMAKFAESVRSGAWVGYTGKRIRTVVNIGIGGSDLGPVMAYAALRSFTLRSIECRYVSNIDGEDFYEKTRDLNPEETLFIVSSKTFTTMAWKSPCLASTPPTCSASGIGWAGATRWIRPSDCRR